MLKAINLSNQKHLGFLCATISYTIWGFSFIIVRIALNSASPEVLLATRFFIAFLMLNFLLLTGKAKISLRGKKIGGLILLGLIDPVLCFSFEVYGIFYTNATLAGAMMALNTIVSLALAALILKEKPNNRQKIFVWLPVTGVMIITASTYANFAIRLFGVALLIAASFCENFARIINRKISPVFTAFERTYTMILLGFTVFATAAVIKNFGNIGFIVQSLCKPSFLVSALILGVFCSFGAFLCMNFAATQLTVTQISVFPSLSTVIAIATGTLILNEPFAMLSVIGAMLIVTGIFNVAR